MRQAHGGDISGASEGEITQQYILCRHSNHCLTMQDNLYYTLYYIVVTLCYVQCVCIYSSCYVHVVFM